MSLYAWSPGPCIWKCVGQWTPRSLLQLSGSSATPAEIFTDNGSNFVGAANEIKDIRKLIHSSKQSLSHLVAEQEVQWHFNPPRAPHFGGLWEAGVKSMKKQLKKLIAPHPLRIDEMQAVLTEVEAILNSRPLVAADQVEAEDELVLTPAHFLIFRPMKAPPTQQAKQAKISTLTRWNLVQRLQQDFAESWKSCYLQSLQARSRWKRLHCNGHLERSLQSILGEMVWSGKLTFSAMERLTVKPSIY